MLTCLTARFQEEPVANSDGQGRNGTDIVCIQVCILITF